MTDAQLYEIITAIGLGLGGIAAAIKWGIGRITKAFDDNGKRIDKNTDAMIDNTASNAVLSTKIDSIANYIAQREQVHDDTGPRSRTPIRGVSTEYSLPMRRASTRGDGDR